jgi:sugar/nucleoside kinase (ribokinase family)
MKFPLQFPAGREFDVVGFGTNAVDYLIRVPEYPEFNSKIELVDYVQAAGGEAATTAAGLRRLGLKTAYIGRFGDDKAGEFGLRSLADEGVDTRFAEQVAGARTQIAFIIIDVRNGERTVIWERHEKLAYSREDVPPGAAELGKVLHFTPHDVEACLELAHQARRSGTIVSIDIDDLFEGVDELLSHVDILIASSDFPAKLLLVDDRRVALREMQQRFGCAIVGVTLGDQGSLLLCGGEFIETKGYAVPNGCKDTTGAGDAFRVGLLHGLLTGRSVEDAAESANAVAALKCREIGARTALPTAVELDELLASRLRK